MTSRFRRAIAAASVTLALGVAGGLAGCAPEPEIAAEQSQAYRSQVVAIAESSAAGDYAGALAALDALQAEIDAAAADGTLSGDREDRIREAMTLVRADLDAAIAAATPPEPAPTETVDDGADDGAVVDDGGDDADEEDSSGPGSGDDNGKTGKGEDKGKGKGKD